MYQFLIKIAIVILGWISKKLSGDSSPGWENDLKRDFKQSIDQTVSHLEEILKKPKLPKSKKRKNDIDEHSTK